MGEIHTTSLRGHLVKLNKSLKNGRYPRYLLYSLKCSLFLKFLLKPSLMQMNDATKWCTDRGNASFTMIKGPLT